MAYDNTGMISKNKFKKTDGQPDITGTANIDGVEKRIAGWLKTRDDGSSYYSLKFQNKDEQKAAAPKADMDDEIPF